jgi:predicted aldo/keto reductase-like oxidoreductase
MYLVDRITMTLDAGWNGLSTQELSRSSSDRVFAHGGELCLSRLLRERNMKRIRLGKSELQVSRVGMGGIPIQRLTEVEAVKVVQRCLDLGINFVDTANGYTTSEERIGKAIAGRREQVIIATKSTARDRASAQGHLELSLKRLNVEMIDLWQLHNVSSDETLEQVLGPGGAMEAARRAREKGMIRHIGITSHSMDVALKAVPMGHFETVQFPFNFVTTEPADKLVPLAREHDVGFIAMKPMAGGLLSNARLCIKYLLQFEVVPDPGIERVDEIDEIVDIVDGPWELSPRELEEIELIRQNVGTRFCRRCGYCEPCPEGVRISVLTNISSFLKRFPRQTATSGWLASAAKTAADCIECGECEEKCPYHLPIREMVAESIQIYESALSAY